MSLTYVVLAAGFATRYGKPKQLDGVGPYGEPLWHYGVYDAIRTGFDNVIVVTRHELLLPIRSGLAGLVPEGVSVNLVVQEEYPASAGRRWGTAHAVLTGGRDISGPFAVANADDFYGAESYVPLARWLGTRAPAAQEVAIVGYPLSKTLSAEGGVSRAVCRLTSDGRVERIIEYREVRDTGDGPVGDGPDPEHDLEADALTSMNLWGFTPALVQELAHQFAHSRAQAEDGDHQEFLLSQAIDQAVREGQTTVHPIRAAGDWFGMTFPEDRAEVQLRLQRLIAAGVYPQRLAPR